MKMQKGVKVGEIREIRNGEKGSEKVFLSSGEKRVRNKGGVERRKGRVMGVGMLENCQQSENGENGRKGSEKGSEISKVMEKKVYKDEKNQKLEGG